MREKTQTSINLSTLVFLVFLTLKLGDIGMVGEWSWWWVTSPLWIPIVIFLGVLLIYVLVILIMVILGLKKIK